MISFDHAVMLYNLNNGELIMLSKMCVFSVVAAAFMMVNFEPIKAASFNANITIDGNKYCECDFWNLPKLEHNVQNYEQLGVPAFNVISNSNLNVADFMRNPENNGAVFQIAANDDLLWTWASGGMQAGAVVEATVLGDFIRKNAENKKSFEKLFEKNSLPTHLGTRDECAFDVNNILIAIHAGLEVKGVKGQIVQVPFVAAYNGATPIERVRNCLKVAYDGTLLTAVQLKTKNVFLTLMGVGVFGNPIDDVIDAIRNSVKRYVKKYGLNVTVLYRGADQEIISKLKSIADYI